MSLAAERESAFAASAAHDGPGVAQVGAVGDHRDAIQEPPGPRETTPED